MSRLHPQPLLATLVLAALPWTAARADSVRMPAQIPPAYTQECGSCHTAYPPGLLPAQSWQRLMGGLDQHFGTDASLDPATVKALAGWLQVNAGTYKRVSAAPPQDRITQSAWFVRKHRQIDTPLVWKHASVKSAANCTACHSQAEQGSFDDDALTFPRGLDERFRRAFLDD